MCIHGPTYMKIESGQAPKAKPTAPSPHFFPNLANFLAWEKHPFYDAGFDWTRHFAGTIMPVLNSTSLAPYLPNFLRKNFQRNSPCFIFRLSFDIHLDAIFPYLCVEDIICLRRVRYTLPPWRHHIWNSPRWTKHFFCLLTNLSYGSAFCPMSRVPFHLYDRPFDTPFSPPTTRSSNLLHERYPYKTTGAALNLSSQVAPCWPHIIASSKWSYFQVANTSLHLWRMPTAIASLSSFTIWIIQRAIRHWQGLQLTRKHSTSRQNTVNSKENKE